MSKFDPIKTLLLNKSLIRALKAWWSYENVRKKLEEEWIYFGGRFDWFYLDLKPGSYMRFSAKIIDNSSFLLGQGDVEIYFNSLRYQIRFKDFLNLLKILEKNEKL